MMSKNLGVKRQNQIAKEIANFVNCHFNYTSNHPGKVTPARVLEVCNGDRVASHPVEAMIIRELTRHKIILDKTN